MITLYPSGPRGQMPLFSQFYSKFTYRCNMQNLVEIGSLVPEKQPKMFNILQPTDDDGQKQIAMGHLGDSGELKSN